MRIESTLPLKGPSTTELATYLDEAPITVTITQSPSQPHLHRVPGNLVSPPSSVVHDSYSLHQSDRPITVEHTSTVSKIPSSANSKSIDTMITRSKVGTVKPNPRYAYNTIIEEVIEPKTVKEGLLHPVWLRTMKEELSALEDNHTWELVVKTDDICISSVPYGSLRSNIKVIILLTC